MPERVAPGETYQSGGAGEDMEEVVNGTTGVIYVCDCCWDRRTFTFKQRAEAHETASASAMSPSDMGIYPGLGEEISDYLPGYQR